MGLAGKVGAVYVQTIAAATTFTDEATTKNADFTRWTITAVAKRYWDLNTAIVVKKNAGVITTGFTIEYPGGVIVFNPAILTTDVILVSGKYFTVAQEGGFFNWSLDISADNAEATVLGSGWKEFVTTVNGFTGSAEMYWGSNRFFALMGSTVILVLYADSVTSMARYECFAIISGDGIETPVDDLVKETIDFQGTGQLYYRP